jgi:hypothetical protein
MPKNDILINKLVNLIKMIDYTEEKRQLEINKILDTAEEYIKAKRQLEINKLFEKIE